MHPISNDLDFWYEQTGPDKFASTYIKVVGGTTWHWLGTCLRFVPNDFRLKTLYGQGVDWPISYDELEPFYGEAEHEIGVSGDSADDLGAPRSDALSDAGDSADLSRQGLRQGARRHDLRGALDAAGTELGDTRGPARLLRQCELHPGLPGPGEVRRHRPCRPRGRGRRDAPRADRRPSSSRSAPTARSAASASSAGTAARAGRPARSSSSPRTRSRRRGCCSTRRARRRRTGSANSSDQVGRNLMDHPTQLSWALANDPVYPYRGPLSTSGIENLRDGEFRKTRGAFRIEIGNDGWSWPTGAPISTAPDLAMQGLRGSGARQRARRPGLAPHPPRLAGRAAARPGEPRDPRRHRPRRLRRRRAEGSPIGSTTTPRPASPPRWRRMTRSSRSSARPG